MHNTNMSVMPYKGLNLLDQMEISVERWFSCTHTCSAHAMGHPAVVSIDIGFL